MTRRSGLGRGLDAILPTDGGDAPEGRRALREVPLDAVVPSADQPRQRFDDESLAELATSIGHLGVLQPLLVTEVGDGTYRLIAGERRLRAARLAGLERVPVVTVEDDQKSSLERALVENLHREDLNPVEEAVAYRGLLEEGGLTQEELGQRLGRNRTTISNSLRLLDLPDSIQRMLIDGRLSAGHGRALLALDGHPMQERLARRIVHENLSVRACEEQVRRVQAFSGQVQRPGRPRVENPALVTEAQKVLGAHLHTRVKVDFGSRRGKIVVDFTDLDDLERLLGVMLGDQARRDSK
ncbi:MAG TPA: ParB/RepB/Spo0J family partition protein [Actinomycetota bacterium]|nr:ParB/RepB/Spo0J family partition protein [Actinomycetota bacterium]